MNFFQRKLTFKIHWAKISLLDFDPNEPDDKVTITHQFLSNFYTSKPILIVSTTNKNL